MATGERVRQILLVGALIATPFVANAQEGSGDPAAGRALAQRVCSSCHVVAPDEKSPRMFDIAPDFAAIANTPGMTQTALRAFMTTSHPKMPNLILSPDQLIDVSAYILSLKARRP